MNTMMNVVWIDEQLIYDSEENSGNEMKRNEMKKKVNLQLKKFCS